MTQTTLISREEMISKIRDEEETMYSFHEAIGILAELKPDPEKLFFEGAKTTQLMWSDYHKCVTANSVPLDYDSLAIMMPLSDVKNPWTPQNIATQEEIKELMKDPTWCEEQVTMLGIGLDEIIKQQNS
ncbi:MAG: hypothetical protein ABF991_00420 [Liquorilactobacillus hordei]|uniref:hypothetical protein n=1 Tax=Liquorilactobacillus hordei TaxID=468911 RepID=UPI0039E7D66D